ncbi:MAG: hypothetical protein LUE86_05775, partial [Clostridiales bacterium]|nr:hypothetical protein [Clostridiales bacterium]
MDQAKKLRKILRRSRLLSPVSVLATLLMAACAVILVLHFAVNIYNVRGDGMQPSIPDGGIIITDSI